MKNAGTGSRFDEAIFDVAYFDGPPAPARTAKPMKTKVKIGWKDLSEEDKLKLARKVKEKCAGNPKAAQIAALLTELDAGITGAETAIGAEVVAQQDAKTATIEKNNSLDTLGGILGRIGSFAEDEYPDEPETVLGLGLDLRADASPIGPLPAPTGMSATGGDHPGTIEGACNPVKGRDIYEGEIATNPNGPWTRVYVGRASSFIASELTPGTEYWLRMRAHGTAGFSPWSGPVPQRAS